MTRPQWQLLLPWELDRTFSGYANTESQAPSTAQVQAHAVSQHLGSVQDLDSITHAIDKHLNSLARESEDINVPKCRGIASIISSKRSGARIRTEAVQQPANPSPRATPRTIGSVDIVLWPAKFLTFVTTSKRPSTLLGAGGSVSATVRHSGPSPNTDSS